MATSGTSSFNVTRDQIIRTALRKIGAIQAGETPSSQLTQDCADQLNMTVKYWQASGIHVWTETESILYTNTKQAMYLLPGAPTSLYTVNATTTATAPALVGATTVFVNSIANATNGGTVGLTLSSGAVQWTTVSSFTSSSIVIPAPGLTDVVQTNSPVYYATVGIVRPLRIPAARRWDPTSQQEIPLIPMSRIDYQNQPNKYTQGTVTQFFYDPRGGANASGVLYLWPTPSDSVHNNIKFTWYRPIQDFNIASDNPDLPQEWINTLMWNLALEMAPEFGPPQPVWAEIKSRAAETLVEVQGWDREPEPTYFGVDFTRLGG